MKPLIKINMGISREVIQWLIRFFLLGAVGLLLYKIYEVNPFFVKIFGGMLLLLALIIPEEKIAADKDVLVITKFFCFNLIRIKKVIRLDKIKETVVAGNLNFSSRVFEMVFPYLERGRASNELRIIYKNGEVKNYRTAIYMDDLTLFETKLKVLIHEKDKPSSFSQPNYREE